MSWDSIIEEFNMAKMRCFSWREIATTSAMGNGEPCQNTILMSSRVIPTKIEGLWGDGGYKRGSINGTRAIKGDIGGNFG